jgi:hypothetical protein
MKIRVGNPWNILPLKTKSVIIWNASLEKLALPGADIRDHGCLESIGTDG